MPDQPADPFLPGDVGAIAIVILFRSLRRAGAGDGGGGRDRGRTGRDDQRGHPGAAAGPAGWLRT